MPRKNSTLIKSPNEIKQIRTACSISAQIHLLAMTSKCIGMTELQLERRLKQAFQKSDVQTWAYPPIIGSGERATQLHAKPTQRVIKTNELVLIDAGVKHQGMASDLTRTWPTGLKFTSAQKTIYKIVLKAQKEVIKRIRPKQNLTTLHEIAQSYLLDGLLSAGVIKKNNTIQNYFPHKTSHWIGKLVHDPLPYFYNDSKPIDLTPGMCFTVEPGLYFKNILGEYNQIGVRIEDVILVTETGHEVLSFLPKEIDEIEYMRSLSIK